MVNYTASLHKKSRSLGGSCVRRATPDGINQQYSCCAMSPLSAACCSQPCSGLLTPDTHLGENARHGEVSDEQATSFVFPRVQSTVCLSGARQRLHHIEASRSVGIAESVLRRWVQQLQLERQGITPDQQRIQELEARIDRLEREKAILKKATALLMSEGIERTR